MDDDGGEVLRLADKLTSVNADLVDELEGLLEDARAGRVTSVCAAAYTHEGEVTTYRLVQDGEAFVMLAGLRLVSRLLEDELIDGA